MPNTNVEMKPHRVAAWRSFERLRPRLARTAPMLCATYLFTSAVLL